MSGNRKSNRPLTGEVLPKEQASPSPGSLHGEDEQARRRITKGGYVAGSITGFVDRRLHEQVTKALEARARAQRAAADLNDAHVRHEVSLRRLANIDRIAEAEATKIDRELREETRRLAEQDYHDTEAQRARDKQERDKAHDEERDAVAQLELGNKRLEAEIRQKKLQKQLDDIEQPAPERNIAQEIADCEAQREDVLQEIEAIEAERELTSKESAQYGKRLEALQHKIDDLTLKL